MTVGPDGHARPAGSRRRGRPGRSPRARAGGLDLALGRAPGASARLSSVARAAAATSPAARPELHRRAALGWLGAGGGVAVGGPARRRRPGRARAGASARRPRPGWRRRAASSRSNSTGRHRGAGRVAVGPPSTGSRRRVERRSSTRRPSASSSARRAAPASRQQPADRRAATRPPARPQGHAGEQHQGQRRRGRRGPPMAAPSPRGPTRSGLPTAAPDPAPRPPAEPSRRAPQAGRRRRPGRPGRPPRPGPAPSPTGPAPAPARRRGRPATSMTPAAAQRRRDQEPARPRGPSPRPVAQRRGRPARGRRRRGRARPRMPTVTSPIAPDVVGVARRGPTRPRRPAPGAGPGSVPGGGDRPRGASAGARRAGGALDLAPAPDRVPTGTRGAAPAGRRFVVTTVAPTLTAAPVPPRIAARPADRAPTAGRRLGSDGDDDRDDHGPPPGALADQPAQGLAGHAGGGSRGRWPPSASACSRAAGHRVAGLVEQLLGLGGVDPAPGDDLGAGRRPRRAWGRR